jgi:hypothetical protein
MFILLNLCEAAYAWYHLPIRPSLVGLETCPHHENEGPDSSCDISRRKIRAMSLGCYWRVDRLINTFEKTSTVANSGKYLWWGSPRPVCACATPSANSQAGIPHAILRGAFLLRYSLFVSRGKKVDILPVHPSLVVSTVRQFKKAGMGVQRDAPETRYQSHTRITTTYCHTAETIYNNMITNHNKHAYAGHLNSFTHLRLLMEIC